jgi:hypothetical protein
MDATGAVMKTPEWQPPVEPVPGVPQEIPPAQPEQPGPGPQELPEQPSEVPPPSPSE